MARKSAASSRNTSRETPVQYESWRYQEQFAFQLRPPTNSSAHRHDQPPTISSTAPKSVVSSSEAVPRRRRTKRASARLSFATSNRIFLAFVPKHRRARHHAKRHLIRQRFKRGASASCVWKMDMRPAPKATVPVSAVVSLH